MHMIDIILGGCLANNKHYYDLKRCNMFIHVNNEHGLLENILLVTRITLTFLSVHVYPYWP